MCERFWSSSFETAAGERHQPTDLQKGHKCCVSCTLPGTSSKPRAAPSITSLVFSPGAATLDSLLFNKQAQMKCFMGSPWGTGHPGHEHCTRIHPSGVETKHFMPWHLARSNSSQRTAAVFARRYRSILMGTAPLWGRVLQNAGREGRLRIRPFKGCHGSADYCRLVVGQIIHEQGWLYGLAQSRSYLEFAPCVEQRKPSVGQNSSHNGSYMNHLPESGTEIRLGQRRLARDPLIAQRKLAA